jgi:hypothetical protein
MIHHQPLPTSSSFMAHQSGSMPALFRLRPAIGLLLLCAVAILAACGKEKVVNSDPTSGGKHDTIPVVKIDTVPSREGLIGYYTFNGNTDDSSGGYTGIIDRAEPATNRFGDTAGAYQFNGVTSKITITMKTLLKDSLTIGAWIFPTAIKTQHIIRRSPSPTAPFELGLSGDHAIVFDVDVVGKGKQLRHEGYPINAWTFLVGTYDGKMLKLYIDGVLTDSVALSGPVADYIDPLIIGSRLQLASDTFQGKIDDIVIYSRAITATEVGKLHALKRQ